MDGNIAQLLQEQMNRERQNAQIYLYIASVFENQAYDGFAKFFSKQAQEELGHADKFSKFLISKRIQPKYDVLNEVSLSSFPLSGITNAVAALEVQTTEHLKDLYDAVDDQDPQVCALLDWFLVEQIEEENWSRDLSDLTANLDGAGWLILDEKYGER